MTVYWRKVEVWCKYPFQHEIDYRYIEFSIFKNRKKFEANVFLTLDTQVSMTDRLAEVQKHYPKANKLQKL